MYYEYYDTFLSKIEKNKKFPYAVTEDEYKICRTS